MLAAARDLLATLFLEKRLAALREEYLSRALDGNTPGQEYWEQGEANIMLELKRSFYHREMHQLVEPGAAPPASEEQDFADRTQKLAEHAVLVTHRILARVPFVGQPEHTQTDAVH